MLWAVMGSFFACASIALFVTVTNMMSLLDGINYRRQKQPKIKWPKLN